MRAVVITGTSSGIGLACATLLAARGFHVFAGVRSATDAQRLSEKLGPAVTPLLFDVTDEAALAAAAESVRVRMAGQTLAGLVNNAGIAVTGPLLHIAPADFRRQIEVNLVGPFLATRAFAGLLGVDAQQRGEPGRVVNISSVLGAIVLPFVGPYTVSKHGLEALGTTFRRELALFGIRVVTVGPSFVTTGFADRTFRDASAPPPEGAFAPAYRKYEEEAALLLRASITPEAVAATVLQALVARRPKRRYAVVGNRLTEWILPRLVPDWLFDLYVARQLGLRPGAR